jgi:hypothetical protein
MYKKWLSYSDVSKVGSKVAMLRGRKKELNAGKKIGKKEEKKNREKKRREEKDYESKPKA